MDTPVWTGPGRYSHLNFVGGASVRMNDVDRNQVDIAVGNGSGIVPWDYVVMPEWATKVATGTHTEGEVLTDGAGHTFIMYSTLQAAVTAAIATGARKTILLCEGTYAEDVTVTASSSQYVPSIYGVDVRTTKVRSITISAAAASATAAVHRLGQLLGLRQRRPTALSTNAAAAGAPSSTAA